jgi:hypothetical protein
VRVLNWCAYYFKLLDWYGLPLRQLNSLPVGNDPKQKQDRLIELSDNEAILKADLPKVVLFI